MNRRPSSLTRSTHTLGQTPARETRTRELLSENTPDNGHRVLWIDGVGGYLLLDQDEVVVGQAVGEQAADVSIVGDLSRRAGVIRRSGTDYVLQPLQPVRLNGSPIDRAQLLKDQSSLQFGERVQMQFSLPSPLSATACLRMTSLNRFKPHVDGVLLLANSCQLGPRPGSHILCPDWESELLLVRSGDQWCFRTCAEVEVDGEAASGQIVMTPGMRMRGTDFSLSIE